MGKNLIIALVLALSLALTKTDSKELITMQDKVFYLCYVR